MQRKCESLSFATTPPFRCSTPTFFIAMNGWGTSSAKKDESDWSSLNPSASEGWDAALPAGWGASSNWSVAAVKPNPNQTIARKEGLPPPAPRPGDKEDDAAAAKEVDKLCATALDSKKKITSLRTKMDELDAKRAELQGRIDELMPELHDLRAQKGAALGVVQGARLPQMWMDKAKELNTRRKTLPGGCTSLLELTRAIKATEEEISHGSLNLKEEKAALERVRELNRGKKMVMDYEADQKALDAVKQQFSSQQAELKPVEQNLDQLKAKTLEKGASMDQMIKERESTKELRTATSASLAELRTALDECFEKVRNHQTDAPKAVARFFSAVRDLDTKLNKDRPDRAPPPMPTNAAAGAAAGAAVNNGAAATHVEEDEEVNAPVASSASALAASSSSAAASAAPAVPAAAADESETVDENDGWTEVVGTQAKADKDKKAKAEAKKAREKAKKAAARADQGEASATVAPPPNKPAPAPPAKAPAPVEAKAPPASPAKPTPQPAPEGAPSKTKAPVTAPKESPKKKAGEAAGKKAKQGKKGGWVPLMLASSVGAVVLAGAAFIVLGKPDSMAEAGSRLQSMVRGKP